MQPVDYQSYFILFIIKMDVQIFGFVISSLKFYVQLCDIVIE